MFGPAESFTPEQFAQQYDVNVLGTQRVNRAVLLAYAQAEAGPAGVGVEQQFRRRHAALSLALLRREGRDGCARRSVCA